MMIFLVTTVLLSSITAVWATHSVSGTDVRVTGVNGQPQFEVTVAVNPGNGGHLVAGYIENNAQGKWQLGRAVSTDIGAHWSTSLFPFFEGFDHMADPAVAFDAAGNAYYVGLVLNKNQCEENACNGSLFISKLPQGGSWTNPSVFKPATCGPIPQSVWHDKPALAVDATTSQFRGRVYVSWTRFETCTLSPPTSMFFAFSTDGVNFVETQIAAAPAPPGFVQYSSVAVAPDGTVYVTWVEIGSNPALSKVRIRRSTDGGISFGPAVDVQGLAVGSRLPIQTVAADRTTSGLVYVVYSDSTGGSGEIRFTRSANGGSTWSTPSRLNDVTTGDQFFPAMSTAPGRIDIIWYDGRSFADGLQVDLFYDKSSNQGQSFTTDLRINGISVPTETTAGFMGDYIGIASWPTYAYPVWTGKVVDNDLRDMVFDLIQFPSDGGGGGCPNCPKPNSQP